MAVLKCLLPLVRKADNGGCHWVTIGGKEGGGDKGGAHVCIGGDGKIDKGPVKLTDKPVDNLPKGGDKPAKTKPADAKKTEPEKKPSETKFGSFEDAHRWGMDYAKQWLKNLTEAESDAVTEYKGGGSDDVNLYLRTGQIRGWGKNVKDKLVAGVDAALAKTSLPEDVTVFRGLGGQDSPSDYLNLKKGDSITDKGFMSTSLDRGVAENWARSGILLKIDTPKGAQAISTDAVFAGEPEAELLLERGKPMTVMSVSKENGTDGKELTVLHLKYSAKGGDKPPESKKTDPEKKPPGKRHKDLIGEIRKGEGTCKPGQRADLTHCTPATDGGGTDARQSKPPESSATASGWSEYKAPGKTAAELSGVTPQRNGKPVPVEKKTLYHVTTRKAAAEILKNGFNLTMVKPRWKNDYAVSTGTTEGFVRRFFTQRGSDKMTGDRVVLKLTVAGRGYDQGKDDEFTSSDAQEYTRKMVKRGYDANWKLGYIYNPKAITSIKVVGPETGPSDQLPKHLFRFVIKSEGTCKPGERADLTHCTPASGGSGAASSSHMEEVPPSRSLPKGGFKVGDLVFTSKERAEAHLAKVGSKKKPAAQASPKGQTALQLSDMIQADKKGDDSGFRAAKAKWEATKVPEAAASKVADAVKQSLAKPDSKHLPPTIADIAQGSNIPVEQVQATLFRMHQSGEIRLTPFTRAIAEIPHPEAVMPLDGEAMWYVERAGPSNQLPKYLLRYVTKEFHGGPVEAAWRRTASPEEVAAWDAEKDRRIAEALSGTRSKSYGVVTKECHWVTIGGKEGEGDKGGAHVCIGEGGKIDKGPAKLIDKPVDKLSGKKKPDGKKKPKGPKNDLSGKKKPKEKPTDPKNDLGKVGAEGPLLSRSTFSDEPFLIHGMSKTAKFHSADAGGVKVHWEENSLTSSLVADKMGEALSGLPDWLKKHTKRIFITKQRSRQDAIWEKQYNIKNFESMATGGDGDVTVYQSEHRSGDSVDTLRDWMLAHEMGHNLAKGLWRTTFPEAGSEYAKAQEQEKPVTDYGKASTAEDFAEAVRLYFGDRKALKKFPKKLAALKNIIAEQSKA